MTSNIIKTSPALKLYKTIYEFMNPLLGIVAVVCGILCCFKSAEGSNSRLICALLLMGSIIGIYLLKGIHRILENKSRAYRLYQSKAARKFEPRNTFPLLFMLVIVAFPFWILLVTSIKTPMEANALNFTWWPQEGISWEAYREVITLGGSIGVSMATATWNSFVYSIVPTLVGLFAGALSAYAFAKLKFKARDTMYQLLIMTMMMPACVTMTTAYIMYDAYGWTDSALPLIIPGCFSAAATVMFLREFFVGIPDELMEAASIDGAGKWRIFFSLILPLGKPALIAQFILGFIRHYNDFMGPLIYLNNPQKYTIQVALSFLNNGVADKASLAAAGMFSLVPMLLIYVVFQKKIIDGISMSSGLKG